MVTKHQKLKAEAQLEVRRLTEAQLEDRLAGLQVAWARRRHGVEFDDIRDRAAIQADLDVTREALAGKKALAFVLVAEEVSPEHAMALIRMMEDRVIAHAEHQKKRNG